MSLGVCDQMQLRDDFPRRWFVIRQAEPGQLPPRFEELGRSLLANEIVLRCVLG